MQQRIRLPGLLHLAHDNKHHTIDTASSGTVQVHQRAGGFINFALMAASVLSAHQSACIHHTAPDTRVEQRAILASSASHMRAGRLHCPEGSQHSTALTIPSLASALAAAAAATTTIAAIEPSYTINATVLHFRICNLFKQPAPFPRFFIAPCVLHLIYLVLFEVMHLSRGPMGLHNQPQTIHPQINHRTLQLLVQYNHQ